MFEAPYIMKGANGASIVAVPVSLMLVKLAIDTKSSTVFYFFIGALAGLNWSRLPRLYRVPSQISRDQNSPNDISSQNKQKISYKASCFYRT